MKTSFVSELGTEQTITSFFLVNEKEIRNSRAGKSYLRLDLGDRSGTIEAVMWDQFETSAKEIGRGDLIKVIARVESYRNKLQLTLQQLRIAKPEEVDLADFLPHTKEDIGKLWAQLLEYANSIENPWLAKLVEWNYHRPCEIHTLQAGPSRESDASCLYWRLARTRHWTLRFCEAVAVHYPELNKDLLLTVAMLHDVGKLDELCYDRAIGYTTEGQLLGHIVMEIETVSKAMDAIEGFPPNLKTVVQHLLISHHGQYEFGSPKLPMIREAMVFHYLDDMDSKMAAVRSSLAADSGEDDWSTYSPALGRKFLKLDAFLKSPSGNS